MEYVFLFSGGPLDGSGLSFDPDNFQSSNDVTGGKIWIDTIKGTVGNQFTVENPFTPKDGMGIHPALLRSSFEKKDEKRNRLLVQTKHVCPMRGTNVVRYEKTCADFIRLLEDADDEVVVPEPEILGKSYTQVIESLNRLARAEKKLIVLPAEDK